MTGGRLSVKTAIVTGSTKGIGPAWSSTCAARRTAPAWFGSSGQPRVTPSESLAESDYRYTLDLNLNSYFVLTQEIVRGMLAAGGGNVIHVSSMNGTVPFPERLGYCVSGGPTATFDR